MRTVCLVRALGVHLFTLSFAMTHGLNINNALT